MCPHCRQAMVDMGNYFRPPRTADRQQWEEMRRVAEHGTRFNTAGSFAWVRFVLRHTTGRFDAGAIIRNCPCQEGSKGQQLLRTIALKRRPRQKRR